MADQKITALTENTAPVLTDILPMVDDPAGTPATQKISLSTLADLFTNNSIYRQAIINGNFDVWQRGTSIALADATAIYQADRWFNFADKGGGTAPTLTLSRQLQTSGDVDKSFYFHRIATNGAGTSYGTSAYAFTSQTIENGTRYLCGASKTVTISFWARSSIASKKLGFYLEQSYGTGGSPSSMEGIVGTTFTLTSSWVKYTATFTTNTLVGKTFGTNNDDNLKVHFAYVMGSALSATRNGTAIANWEGSGNIDIAQVQLCAGSVALPFLPKSFEEELRACQRYYEKSYTISVTPGTATDVGAILFGTGTNTSTYIFYSWSYKVTKRIVAAPVIYDVAGNINKITTLNAAATQVDNVAYTGVGTHDNGSYIYWTGSTVTGARFQWTVSAEL